MHRRRKQKSKRPLARTSPSAREVGDRIILMADGTVVEQDEPERLFTNPRTERAKQFLQRLL